MGVLTEKAILELIVDSTKGVDNLEDFQKKFTEGFEKLRAETDALGEGITHLNDPLRRYAFIADEAAVGTAEWAKAISLVDPQLGALVNKIRLLSNGLLAKNAELAKSFSGMGALAIRAGGLTTAAIALGKTTEFLTEAYTAQNQAFDYTASLLKELGFEKAGADLQGFLDKTREGEQVIQGLAESEARVKAQLDETGKALIEDTAARLERAEAVDRERKAIEASSVSDQEKHRLLLELAAKTRAAKTETDALGNTVVRLTGSEIDLVAALEKHEKALRDVEKATTEAIEEQEEYWTRTRGALSDILQIDALDQLDARTKNLIETFKSLGTEVELTREEKIRLHAEAESLREAYKALGVEGDEALKTISAATFDLVGETEKLTDTVRGNREDLEKRTAVLVQAGAELREVAKGGKLSAEASQEFAEEIVELVEDWEKFGETAPPALKALLALYPDLTGEAKKYREELKITVDLNREFLRSLEDTIRAKREASGIGDVQGRQESLSEEVRTLDELERVQGLTLEQSERLFEARSELSKAERELGRAVRDTGLEWLEQERAQAEAELTAAEHEQQQLDLAERMREAGIEADGLSESLFDLAQTQEGANSASDAAAQAYAEAAEGANALTTAVKAADPVTEAWISKMNAGLTTTISLLKEAKQCAVDLGGAMDQV